MRWRNAASAILLWHGHRLVLAEAPQPPSPDILNNTLLWGPYRPNLYFGMRPRIPSSVLTGLMWTRIEDGRAIEKTLRHECTQSDALPGYGWTTYDPRLGGRQMIHDDANGIDLTTELFLDAESTSLSPHGGNWGVRVRGRPRAGASRSVKTTVVWYFGLEDEESDGTGEMGSDYAQCKSLGEEGVVECLATTEKVGKFRVRVGNEQRPTDGSRGRMFVYSMTGPPDDLWNAKSIFLQQVKDETDKHLGDESSKYTGRPGWGNLHFIQQVFQGAFQFDIHFTSGSAPVAMTAQRLTSGIQQALASIPTRFEEVFPLQRPFDDGTYSDFATSALSNLLGGIGYFHGDSLADLSYVHEYDEHKPHFWEAAALARARRKVNTLPAAELFASTPSRSFFPRGFLWDEGFHLRVIAEWDLDLALAIVKSWLGRMDDDGWIAREQILGAEARSRVPQEFQVQYPHHANPPTIFYTAAHFIDILTNRTLYTGHPSQVLVSRDSALVFVRWLYPLLKRHYAWFRRTQAGNSTAYARPAHDSSEVYRWRGRTPQHTLPSGLDDYPRASPPHPGELHVDALSWVYLMADTLSRVATLLEETADVVLFQSQRSRLRKNVIDLHWSEDERAFCDSTITQQDKYGLVCHKGYVSLMPWIVGMIHTQSKQTAAVLRMLESERHLWSKHGIRSLSLQDEFFGTGEKYWRGPVWVNMNFLILERLLAIAQTPGRHQSRAQRAYSTLRLAIVTTIHKAWMETGFLWEQYDAETGEGLRTHPFAGWTALVVKIMSMPRLPDSPDRSEYLRSDDQGVRGEWSGRRIWLVAAGVLFVLLVRRTRRGRKLWRRLLAHWKQPDNGIPLVD